jgi:hypothetical protein
MSENRYVMILLGSLALLLGITAAFNRIVDPFWFFRDIEIPGFNLGKPEFHKFERHIKPAILRRNQPQAVIFGNSYAEIGFDPTAPAFTEDGMLRGFNFAMAGSDWTRLYCSVVFALNHTPMKRAVIGLPYWNLRNLPKPDCGTLFAEIQQVPLPTLLLSTDALRASWKTVRKQRRTRTHTPEGLYFFTRDQNSKREKLFNSELLEEISRINTSAKECAAKIRLGAENRLASVPKWTAPAKGSDMSGLGSMLELLAEKHVELKLVVFPLHVLPMEAHILCGNPLGRWQALSRIAALVDDINRRTGSNIEFWDFQGTSAYLTETIRNNTTRYWQDTGHFNPEIGNIMLDTMFHRRSGPLPGESEPFGIMLSEASVVERFEEFFRYRREFLATHPAFDRELANRIDPALASLPSLSGGTESAPSIAEH